MADNSGFDPCECMYSDDSAMSRLINMLRQSQSYCTDNQCPSTLPGPQTTSSNYGDTNLWMILGLWLLLMVGFMFARQGGGRRLPFSRGNNKPNREDHQDFPPQPPGLT